MADERAEARQDMADELEGATVAPGVVASKSQTQGGAVGLVGFGFIGLVLGVILGLVAFGGSAQAVIISGVAFAFAGGTAGVLIGGFTAPRKKLEDDGSAADK
ncbi:MAG: hypothetical protein M3217_09410 [Actinomycetota bacterium]|nr:hypothetical protein [Actinomycetota bacterium]